MTDLVDDLFDVSRVTRGLVSIEKAELDSRDVIHSAIEQSKPLIDSRGHALSAALRRTMRSCWATARAWSWC